MNVCIFVHTEIFIMSLVATTGITLVSISEKEDSLSPTFLKKWVRAQSITLEKYSWYVVKWKKASRTVMFIIWPCFCFQMLWEWRFEITATRLLKLIITNVWIMRCHLLELQFFFLIGCTCCAGGKYKLIQKTVQKAVIKLIFGNRFGSKITVA